jgi:hypothetical protein
MLVTMKMAKTRLVAMHGAAGPRFLPCLECIIIRPSTAESHRARAIDPEEPEEIGPNNYNLLRSCNPACLRVVTNLVTDCGFTPMSPMPRMMVIPKARAGGRWLREMIINDLGAKLNSSHTLRRSALPFQASQHCIRHPDTRVCGLWRP